MTTTLLAPPDEVINLTGISWTTYETLLVESSDRRLRMTYNRGNLEIMAPSPEHELSKTVMGRYIPILELAGFLQQSQTMDYLELIRSFRAWVRSQIERPDS